METHSQLQTTLMILIVTLFYTVFPQLVDAEEIVHIGVLSPTSGEGSPAGHAHRFWAYEGLDNVSHIRQGGNIIMLRAVPWDTESLDKQCSQNVDDFLKEHPSIAIIMGPLRTGCMENILDQSKHPVPIVSAMVSGTALTEKENKWFFRANVTDAERLRRLVGFIDTQDYAQQQESSILIYDRSTEFGKGLKEDFLELRPHTQSITIEDALTKGGEELEQLVRDANVFLLGGAKHTLAFGRHLRQNVGTEVYDSLQLYTVGSSNRLLNFRSDRVTTIGEVGFGSTNSLFARSELDRVVERGRTQDYRFYPTVYLTARHIVPEAVSSAIARIGLAFNSDIQKLRDAIRTELERNEGFSSLTPPRRVHFSRKHDLMGDLDFPIYRLGWEMKRANMARQDSRWLELTAYSPDVSFGESPISVNVVGHNLNGAPVKVNLRKKDGNAISTQTINQEDVEQTITFHPSWVGNYEITSNIDFYPRGAIINADFTLFYLVCVIAAGIGVICRVKPNQPTWRLGFTILEGMVLGVVVALLSSYVRYTIFPEVSADWNLLNAGMYGLIGGYFGPSLVSAAGSQIFNRDEPSR